MKSWPRARWPDQTVFGGRVIPQFPPGTPEVLKHSDYSGYVFAIHDLPQAEGLYPAEGSPVGPNCWFRRGLFDAGWRYDPTIGPSGRGRISGSELEFYTRLKAAGHEFLYVPSVRVQHRIQSHQTTIKYSLECSYASGRGGRSELTGILPSAKNGSAFPATCFASLPKRSRAPSKWIIAPTQAGVEEARCTRRISWGAFTRRLTAIARQTIASQTRRRKIVPSIIGIAPSSAIRNVEAPGRRSTHVESYELSVIIATFNRAQCLDQTLEHCCAGNRAGSVGNCSLWIIAAPTKREK